MRGMFYQEVRVGKGWFVMKMRRRARIFHEAAKEEGRGMVFQDVKDGEGWFVMKEESEKDGLS